MKSLLTFSKSRLAKGTAVGVYGVVIVLLVQLLSVPVLTRSWVWVATVHGCSSIAYRRCSRWPTWG